MDCFVALLLAMTDSIEMKEFRMTETTIDTGTNELLCVIRDRVADHHAEPAGSPQCDVGHVDPGACAP